MGFHCLGIGGFCSNNVLLCYAAIPMRKLYSHYTKLHEKFNISIDSCVMSCDYDLESCDDRPLL